MIFVYLLRELTVLLVYKKDNLVSEYDNFNVLNWYKTIKNSYSGILLTVNYYLVIELTEISLFSHGTLIN